MTITDDQSNQNGANSADLDLIPETMEDDVLDAAELWQEFDEAEGEAAPTDDAAAAGADASPDPSGEDDSAGKAGDDGKGAATDDGNSEDFADDDSASRQSGAPPDAATDKTQKPTDQTAAPEQAAAVDWANASPDHRAAFNAAQAELTKLRQSDRSNRGRISALQRQINELVSGKAPAKAASGNGAASEAGDAAAAAEEFLGGDEWKSFQEEYPEVAGPMAKAIAAQQSTITRLEKQLSAIGQERIDAAEQEQYDLLVEKHPDWDQVAGTAEFAQWLNNQPRHIREAAMRNGEAIVDAEEAIDVIDRYKAHVGTSPQQGAGQQQHDQGGGARETGAGNGSGQAKSSQQLDSRRRRQLESASGARSRGPGAVNGIPEDGDPEQIWKQFDAMEARQGARG